MNRIYKVVWSKVKHCYIVVSELAKNRTKFPQNSMTRRLLVLSVLLAVLSFGAVFPVSAATTADIPTGFQTRYVGTDSGAAWSARALPSTNVFLTDWHTASGGDLAYREVGSQVYSIIDGFYYQNEGMYRVLDTSDRAFAGATATGSQAIAMGLGTNVAGTQSVGIGSGTNVAGTQGVGIGHSAYIASNVANGVAIGDGAYVTGDGGIRIGGATDNVYGTIGVASGAFSVSIGMDTTANANQAIAIGRGSAANKVYSIAIGESSVADTDASIAIGLYAYTHSTADESASNNIAIGSRASTYGGMAIGVNAQAGTYENRGQFDVAIGENAKVYGKSSVGLGYQSLVDTNVTNGIALGSSAHVSADGSIALGLSSSASGVYGVSIGSGSSAVGAGDVAIGNDSAASYAGGVAVGQRSKAANNSVAIGRDAISLYSSGASIGVNSYSTSHGYAIGNAAHAYNGSLAFGNNAYAGYDNNTPDALGAGLAAIAVGTNAKASQQYAISFGRGSLSDAVYAMAVGDNAQVLFGESLPAEIPDTWTATPYGGYFDENGKFRSNSSSAYSMAIGGNARVNGNSPNSIAIGGAIIGTNSPSSLAVKGRIGTGVIGGISIGGSTTTVADDTIYATAIGHGSKVAGNSSIAMGTSSVADEDDVVSFGHKIGDVDGNNLTMSDNVFRRIINVADGVNDNDVVTVGQLDTTMATKADVYAGNIGSNLTLAEDDYPAGATDEEKAALLAEAKTVNAQAWGTALGTGAVVSGNIELVTGNILYTETRPSDGNYVLRANTTSQNLTALDTQLKTVTDGLAQEVTDRTTAVSNEATTRTTEDTNLSNRIGTVADGTHNYIQQSSSKNVAENLVLLDTALKTTNDTVASNKTAIEGALADEADARADADTALGNRIDTLSGNAVQYDGNEKTKVTLEGTGGTTLDNMKAGTLSADSMEAVNGSQLYTTNQALAQEVADRATTVTDEATARSTEDTNLSNRIGSVSADGNYIKASSAKNVAENFGLLDTAVKTNADAIAQEVTDRGTAIANEVTARQNADTALSDRIDVLSGNAVHYDSDAKTKVTLEGTGGTIIDNVKAGTLSADSKEAVNGSQLYTTNQALAQEVTDRTNAIFGEATTRANADTALSGRIGTVADGTYNYIQQSSSKNVAENLVLLDSALKQEETDRIAGDTAITNKIGTIGSGKNYIAESNTVAVNLEALDAQLKTTTDNLAQEVLDRTDADTALGARIDSLSGDVVHYDVNSSKAKITLEGTNGTTIDNVKDGTLSATSKEAVNGSQLYTTNTNLANEISARESADTTLQTNITNETTARQSADTTLQGNIDAEASARSAGDTALTNKIGSIAENGNYIGKDDTVFANLSALDTNLKATADALATETTNRTNADNTLQSNIEAETTAREQAIATLTANMGTLSGNAVQYDDAEKSKVTLGGEETGTTIDNLKDGTLSATSKEAVNGSQLYTTNQNLASEVSARQSADTTLQANITAEETARTTADTTLQGNIDAEASARSTADTTLQSNIDTEASARASADTVLQNSINTLDGVAVKYDSAETKAKITLAGAEGTTIDNLKDATLSATSKEAVTGKQLFETNTALSAETTARENADTALHTNLGAEITARTNADTDLSDRIGAITEDKNYIKASVQKNVSENLEILDSALKTTNDTVASNKTAIEGALAAEVTARENADTALSDRITALSGNAVHYDGDTKVKITLEGTGGTTIDNVKDGVLSADSKEAVNGSQLYTTNQALAQEVTDRATAVSNEVTARADADTALSGRIGTLTADGNYIKSSDTKNVYENLSLLDAQVKANADQLVSDKTHFFGVNSTNEYDMNYNGQGASGSNAIAVGPNAWAATDNSIAIGSMSATMFGEKATAVGYLASALEEETIAIGSSVQAPNKFATAVGSHAIASGWSSTAIGKNAVASGKNSIAVGSDSTATGEDEFSVGRPAVEANAEYNIEAQPEVKRRITHVDDGVNDTDAVNVKQLADVSDTKANIGLDNISPAGETVIRGLAKGSVVVVGADKAAVTKTDVDGVDTYTVSVKADGVVAEGNGDIVSGGAVYEALQAQQTGTGTVLETKANIDASNITDATAWGAKIATGTVTDSDVKAVSGGTLFNELRPSFGNYITSSNTTAWNLAALDTQVKTNADAVAGHTTDIANLKDLATITETGEAVIRNLSKGSVNVVGGTYATVNKTDADGVDTYTVNVATDGAVADGNTKLVTGGTVYEAIRSAINTSESGTGTALGNKANISLDNLDDAGTDVIRTTAKLAVVVTNGTNTTVSSETDTDGTITYQVAAVTNGAVTEDNTGIVTGGTVYGALRDETRPSSDGNYIVSTNTAGQNLAVLDTNIKTVSDALAQEVTDRGTVASGLDARITANTTDISHLKDMSNLTEDGQGVIKTLSKGSVNVTGTGKAVVSKSDASGVDLYTVSVDGNGEVVAGNEDLVTGGTVFTALENRMTEMNTVLGTKADVSLGNLTGDGETVVRELAKDAVKVVDGTHTTVAEGTDGNSKTYAVNVATDGTVADGNEGIVSGGSVYTAIQNALGDMNTSVGAALDGKTNVSLDNLSEAGENVVKGLAKSSVNVTSSGLVSVTKTDVDGTDTYQVSVTADGAVAEGDTNAVSGGTVYTALQAQAGAVDTALGTKANADASNVTDAVAWGAKLATGSVAAGDTRAVSGSTVAALVADLQTASGDALDTKANVGLDNLSADGQAVVRNLAKDSVGLADGTHTMVSETTIGNTKTYSVNVVADGAVASGNIGLIDGNRLYQEVRLTNNGNYVSASNPVKDNVMVLDTTLKNLSDTIDTVGTGLNSKAGTDLDNLSTAGQTVIRDLAKGSVNVQPGTHTTVVKATENGVDIYTVNTVANGTVADNNTGLVTGGAVHTAIENALATANDSLNDGLLLKANKDASNIDTGAWSTVLGTGTVNAASTDLVTGRTVAAETRVAADGNYIRQSNSAAQNLSVLDTALQETRDIAEAAAAVGQDANAVHYDNAGKSAVTLAGASGTVIHNVADGAVSATSTDAVTGKQLYEVSSRLATANTAVDGLNDQVAGQGTAINDLTATVSDLSSDIDTVKDTVTAQGQAVNTLSDRIGNVSAKADANETAIASLRTQVAGTADAVQGLDDRMTNVETSVQTLEASVDNKITGKADADLTNLSDAGNTVIRNIAKDALTVRNGSNVSVEKSVENDKDVYTVNIVGNGTVSLGDTGLVTGGAVYDALQNFEPGTDIHYVSVNAKNKDDYTYENTGATGDNATALGVGSKAQGGDSIAVGHGNTASGRQSIAIGTGNTVSGDHSGAFGDPNTVTGSDSYVIGNNNTVSGNNSFVLSNNATVTGHNSVVLGDRSDGSQDNVVSVGSAGNERKIVHVADGTIAAGSTDAVTGGQLFNVRKDLQDARGIDTQKWSQALGTGTVTSGDGNLVTGDTVFTAIQAMGTAGGTVVPDTVNGKLDIGANPAYDGIDTVSIAKSDGTGRVMTGVVTDPDDQTSATNVAYVNAVSQNLANSTNRALEKLNTKANKIGANAAALAALQPPPMDGDEKWAFSAAVGHYEGQTAGAVGAFYRPQDNIIINLRGTVGNGEDMIGAGVGIALNRGKMPGVTKAKLAKAVNAQAAVIEQLQAEQREKDRKHEAEIVEMKAQIATMAKTMQKLAEAKKDA